jgi:hypothetical protein
VSKDFDGTLSDALDLAAHAAETSGPAAARIRGRKRTMHHRIALSTASLVMVAVGATAGFKAATADNGGSPQPTGGSPGVTASLSTAGTPSNTGGSPTPPTQTSSSPAASIPATTGSATTGSPTTGSPSSSRPAGADPQQVAPGAWLSADQIPFAGTYTWNPVPGSQLGGQQLSSSVAYIANNTSYQTLTMCADPAQLLSRTIGAQVSGFTTTTTSSGNNQANQYIFFFADAASAQQTYTWLETQYTSSCLLNGSGAQVTKTAGDSSTGMAWLTLKGTSTSPDLPLYEREYFVLRGSTIAYVSMVSYTKTLPTAYNDTAQLATIAAHLCVYGGSCS